LSAQVRGSAAAGFDPHRAGKFGERILLAYQSEYQPTTQWVCEPLRAIAMLTRDILASGITAPRNSQKIFNREECPDL
jgi:hypothetical protein